MLYFDTQTCQRLMVKKAFEIKSDEKKQHVTFCWKWKKSREDGQLECLQIFGHFERIIFHKPSQTMVIHFIDRLRVV